MHDTPLPTRYKVGRLHGSALVGGRPARHREQLGWRLGGPVLALLTVLTVGTVGYVVIEGWSVEDAVFMAVTTVTTVGYREVHPLSTAGRYFTIGLLLVGVGALFYTFGSVMAFVFEGPLTQQWERRRMEKRVQRLADHYLLCGYGRVGRQIARDLQRGHTPFVVIDVNQASLDQAAADGLPIVYGNATEDEVLRQAGIERAGGLITAIADDADNIFVTLSARALRPDLPIVARANHDDAIHKLRRAGATQVVSPYAMAGQQMALLAVRPAVVDFVETLLHGSGEQGNLLLEEVRIAANAALAGASVAEAHRRFANGATLLALQRDGRMLAPPSAEITLRAGDVLAVLGTADQLRMVEVACEGAAPAG